MPPQRGASPPGVFTVGVLGEAAPGEQRVALVPESLSALAKSHIRVLVASGAGAGAWFPDGAYTQAGGSVTTADEVIAHADALVAIGAPRPSSSPAYGRGK